MEYENQTAHVYRTMHDSINRMTYFQYDVIYDAIMLLFIFLYQYGIIIMQCDAMIITRFSETDAEVRV